MSLPLVLVAMSLTPDLGALTPEPDFGAPLAPVELDGIRGMQLPVVGLDLAGPTNVASGSPPLVTNLPSQTLREMVDNWTLDVLTPLIADTVRQTAAL